MQEKRHDVQEQPHGVSAMPEPTYQTAVDTRHATLAAFARSLRHEAYVLAQRPDLLWQQLYNRLQWDPVVQSQLADTATQRGRDAADPWLKLHTPLPESGSLMRALGDLGSRVLKITLSPDGSTIALATAREVSLWDSANGQRLWSHPHSAYISYENQFQCTFSSDGQLLATGLSALTVWTVRTGMLCARLDVHDAYQRAGIGTWVNTYDLATCAFSPDDQELLTLDIYGTLTIWDTQKWAIRTRRDLHRSGWGDAPAQYTSSAFGPCTFSPDTTALVAHVRVEYSEHHHTSALNLWTDVRTQTVGARLETGPLLHDCCFSRDGGTLVTIGSHLSLWDTQSWHKRTTVQLSGARCATSTDGKAVFVADSRGMLWLMDLTADQLGAIRAHVSDILACACSSAGHVVATGGADQTVRLWDAEQAVRQGITPAMKAQIRRSAEQQEMIGWCAYSARGQTLVSAGGFAPDSWLKDGYVVALWDAQTCEKRTVLGRDLKAFALDPKRKTILTAEHSALTLWDLDTATVQRTYDDGIRMRGITTCAVSMQGASVAAASLEGGGMRHTRRLNVWDTAAVRPREIAWLPAGSRWYKACAFSPDRRHLLLTDGDTLWLCRTHAPRRRTVIRRSRNGHGELGRCAFSLDGTTVLSFSEGTREQGGDSITLWSLRHKRRIATIHAHVAGSGGHLPNLATTPWAMSPDGSAVVLKSPTNDPDRAHLVLQAWDIHSGHRLVTYAMRAERVSGFCFSPDGRLLFVVSEEHTLSIWDATTGTQQAVMYLPTALTCVAAHPWKPFLAVGTAGGELYLIELVGVTYGPIVVTAVRRRRELEIECPICAQPMIVREGKHMLGHVTQCTRPSCAASLRISSFVIRDTSS